MTIIFIEETFSQNVFFERDLNKPTIPNIAGEPFPHFKVYRVKNCMKVFQHAESQNNCLQ